MKFQSHLNVAGSPDVKLRLRPIAVDIAAEGGAEITTGQIGIGFGKIPVLLRIPFHRHRVVAAQVGPFRMRVQPFNVALRCVDVRLTGTVGSEAGGIDASVVGACGAKVGIEGDWHGSGFASEAASEAAS